MTLKEAMELEELYSAAPAEVTPVGELSYRLQEVIAEISAAELAALFNERVAGTPIAHLPEKKSFARVRAISDDFFLGECGRRHTRDDLSAKIHHWLMYVQCGGIGNSEEIH